MVLMASGKADQQHQAQLLDVTVLQNRSVCGLSQVCKMTGNNPKAYLILKCSRNAAFHPFVDTTCNKVMPHTNKGQREEGTFTGPEQVTVTHLSQLSLQQKGDRLEKLMHIHYRKAVMQK